MNPYQECINSRGITCLCHFTKSSNLPFIFGNDSQREGILSSDRVCKEFGNSHVMDKKRLDNHRDYVCCSVQKINPYYYRRRKNEERHDLFNQWVTVFINPYVINDTSLFCPTNAATKRGKYIRPGSQAFESLFNSKVPTSRGFSERNSLFIPACQPTDVQAEVLIKDRIPRNALLGVAFPNNSINVEKKRISFWFDGEIEDDTNKNKVELQMQSTSNIIRIYNWNTCIWNWY